MDGEVLQLTRSVDTVTLGSANAGGGVESQVGFVSLLREHFVRLPTRSFVLDCSLRMGGPRDSGGEGLSISYGDIPEAALKEGVSVGERGAGRGLRLLLRTYVHNQLVVMWDNVIMHTVAVDLG